MDPTFLIMMVLMLGGLWLMSSFTRRAQQRMADEQKKRTEEALVEGNWVRTRAGFYGKVVEVDGDVVTLATPLGDETLWAKETILCQEEPPFAAEPEEAAVQIADETETASE